MMFNNVVNFVRESKFRTLIKSFGFVRVTRVLFRSFWQFLAGFQE